MAPRVAREKSLRFEALEARQMLATYYVDGQLGSDQQTVGSIEQPFATISHAATLAHAGDTVSIRGGVYREQVNLSRSGTATAPIAFEAYDGEDVLVTTTDPLTGWTLHSGNIYRTSFDSSVRGRNNMTLFVDGQLMDEAHWSDLGGNIDRLDNQTWSSMSSGTRTTITDTALRNMSADMWVGGFVQAQTIDWSIEVKRIVDFSSNGTSGTITVESPFFYDPRAGDRYLIYNDLDALDAPGEWYFDEGNDTLYFWAPGGVNPNTLVVEAKGPRDEAFDLNGHDYIHIRDIHMRGGDLDMSGSSHTLLEGAHIQMPDYGFGPEGSGGVRSLIVNGSHNTIRDSEFHGVHGTAVHLEGSNNAIYNNYFHDIGYNNVNGAAFNVRAGGAENLISHNTIARVGRAAIGGPGGIQNVIQYNDFSEIGLMSGDVGAIYFANNSLGNMVIHHNVLHDIDRYKAFGIYFDNNSTDATVHHNITYNTPNRGGATNSPNSFLLWFNNTHYNAGNITTFAPPGSSGTATGTKFYNNILSSIDPDLLGGVDPAEASNNVFTSSSSNFVNAAQGDFRLLATSAAVDAGREIVGITEGFAGAAPDAGALELGQAMWAVGHDFANPHRPVYLWQPVPFSNRVANPSFDVDLSNWSTATGTPQRYYGNAWNYRSDALATFGVGSLEVKPGDQLEQTLTGLVPNTIYEVQAKARIVKDLQLEVSNGTSGAFTTGNHRGEDYLGDVDAGEWVRFTGVDFGTSSPYFDRIEMGTNQNSALDVELRLGSSTGQLIGTLEVPSRGEPWFMTRANIASVTGTHDLYVVFQGVGGPNGRFDRIRLLNTNESERVTFGVKDFDGPGSTSSIAIGDAYWSGAAERMTFTTGPDSDSAIVFISKQGGHLNGYVDGVALSGEAYQAVATDVLEVAIDSTSGRAVLRNNTADPISFDGYAIRDVFPSLLPDTWFSLSDQHYEANQWVEGNPSSNALTELRPISITALEPGEMVYLGRAIDVTASLDPTFEYFLSQTNTLTQGNVRFESLALPGLPGDYTADGIVDGSDYTVWRDSLGAEVSPFSNADGNGSGVVDQADYLLWRRHFGQGVFVRSLIDAATNNGSFEDFAGGQGAPEQTNPNRVANAFDTLNVTDTAVATIPGWTSVLERYLDGTAGNTFAGFDSAANRSSDGARYAFANKRSRATLTSDPVEHITQVGDEFTLMFDTGSFTSDNAAYVVRMRFGQHTREIDYYTETINGNGVAAAYTLDRTYTYTAAAADAGVAPIVEFVINAGPNASGTQWYVDDVRLSVATTANLLGSGSSLSQTSEGEAALATAEKFAAPRNDYEPALRFEPNPQRIDTKKEVANRMAAKQAVFATEAIPQPGTTQANSDLLALAIVRPTEDSALAKWIDEGMAAYEKRTENEPAWDGEPALQSRLGPDWSNERRG